MSKAHLKNTPLKRLLAAAVFCLLSAVAVDATTGEVWQSSALHAGDVRSLAIDPENPDRVLAGTSSGQLYVTEDGADSWSHAGALLPFAGSVVSDLLFDPNTKGRVWAALWTVWGSDGRVMLSEDNGATWESRSGGLPEKQVYALAAVEGEPERLYAATRVGVWGTTDDGATWSHLTAGHRDIGKVTSLLVDPENPSTVYAGTWRRAYRSLDGGSTWSGIFEGMLLDSEVFTIRPSPGYPGELWASTCGWVYRGTRRGEHWTRFTNGLAERRTPSFEVLADGRLLAGTVAGLYISEDNARSFTRRSPEELPILAIAHDANRFDRILLGTEGGGVWRSVDGGATFSEASRGMSGLRISGVVRHRDELLVAVRHAGPLSGVYTSLDGGLTFESGPHPLPTILGLTDAGDRVYAATEGGLWMRWVGEWRRVDEVGTGRVQEVAAVDGRVVARTPTGLWEQGADGFFAQVDYHHGPPRSMAISGRALWVTDGDGVYRLTEEANHEIATPFADGRLSVIAGEVLLAGDGGLWRRDEDSDSWESMSRTPLSAIETGDERYPLLVLQDVWKAELLEADNAELLDVELPVPPRDVSAAFVVGDRLLIGTSGYGVLHRPLPQPAPEPEPEIVAEPVIEPEQVEPVDPKAKKRGWSWLRFFKRDKSGDEGGDGTTGEG